MVELAPHAEQASTDQEGNLLQYSATGSMFLAVRGVDNCIHN